MISRLTDRPLRLVILITLLLIGQGALAHTALKESVPADGTTVSKVPESLNLVFNGPVRLIRLELRGAGDPMATEFKPNREPQTEFLIAAPGMSAGKFTVSWAAIGADGHTVTNDFSFIVAPSQ